ncbi:MAG: VapC toxin family PIN domain ribonuclease [Armatimonadetes bacterium CG07_land_8_20_14_0_80_40_9]|nr:MAG: VapC toxin family PIN domain ribonuclease [Armatimonadetes bacterium CG07_land_8_20_14_0_80_40_9]
MTYALDTNIVTAILKGNEKVKKKAQKAKFEGRKILINGISYYEIKRGLLATDATAQLKRFELLCSEFGLVLLDTRDIFDRAAEIYADLKRKGKLVEDADILIASVVSFRNFILVSNDTDFNRIQGLKTENWLN